MEAKAATVGILNTQNEDIRSLRELLIYGVKGIAAYAEHAYNLGFEDPSISAFIQEALGGYHQRCTHCRRADRLGANLWRKRCKGNGTARYSQYIDLWPPRNHEGKPRRTQPSGYPGSVVTTCAICKTCSNRPKEQVSMSIRIAKCYRLTTTLLSKSTATLWATTVARGGNKRLSFESFNGVILFTTNCIVPPRPNATYADRVYTTGSSGFGAFKHIADRPAGGSKDFSALIGARQTLRSSYRNRNRRDCRWFCPQSGIRLGR